MQLLDAILKCEDAPEERCIFALDDVRTWFREAERLRLEIAELKRTRSEDEAKAKVQGFRDGQKDIVRQLQAQSINIEVSYKLER